MPHSIYSKRSAAVGALGLLALVIFWTLRASDEKVIRRMLEAIAHKASFEGAEPPLARMSIARELATYADRDVVLRVRLSDEEGRLTDKEYRFNRQEIPGRIVSLRQALAQFALSIDVRQVRIFGERAEVIADCAGLGREPGREDLFLEKHRVLLQLKKAEGRWLICQAENLPEAAQEGSAGDFEEAT